MKVDKMVPKIYYSESRDFSFIGRLFEIVLNYMKTNADLVDNNLDSENISELALQLLNYTLGFESKHDYDNKDLIYLASSFSELLREKGTTNSIKKAIQLLLTSQQIDKSAETDILLEHSENDAYYWECYVPAKLKDIVLLEDLLDYILPAGVLFSIISTDTMVGNADTTEINSITTFKDFSMNDSNLGRVYSDDGGIVDITANNQIRSISTLGVVVTEVISGYSVTYFDGDEELINLKQTGLSKLSLPAGPSKEGYTFNGWYYEDGTTQAENGTVININTELYAKYTSESQEEE